MGAQRGTSEEVTAIVQVEMLAAQPSVVAVVRVTSGQILGVISKREMIGLY